MNSFTALSSIRRRVNVAIAARLVIAPVVVITIAKVPLAELLRSDVRISFDYGSRLVAHRARCGCGRLLLLLAEGGRRRADIVVAVRLVVVVVAS